MLRTAIKYMSCIALGFLLALLVLKEADNLVRRAGSTSVHRTQTSSKTPTASVLTGETSVSVAPKVSTAAADLVVKNGYVADINGERVEAPMVSSKDNSGTQATVTNTIDITPLVNQMTPKWEAGVGLEYNYNDKKVLPCMSLQRNYRNDRAVEIVVTVDNKNIERGMLLHKWMF